MESFRRCGQLRTTLGLISAQNQNQIRLEKHPDRMRGYHVQMDNLSEDIGSL